MKVLVLCYEYPPIGGGGGRVAQVVARQLAARGHELRVLTAGLGWRSEPELDGAVHVRRMASGRRAPDSCTVREMALHLLFSLPVVLRCAARWKPDVIHAHFALPTGLLALAAKLFTGAPYVLTAHLGDVPGGVPEQTDRLFRWLGPIPRQVWRHASAATAVSSFVQELAEKAYRRPVTRILNGIDLSSGKSIRRPADVSGPVRFLFLGRFNPQKNPLALIDIFRSLPARLAWTLTMIGDGPLLSTFRNRVMEAGLGSRVTCAGWLSADAVDGRLQEADVLCLPSSSEGLPVAGVEALRNGLAILASDIPGVRDLVAEGVNGFLVPLGDTAAFAARIELLCTDRPRLALLQAASLEKVRAFDLSAIVTQYEQTLQAARRIRPSPS